MPTTQFRLAWSYIDVFLHYEEWRIEALCVLLVDKTNITTKIFGCKQAALSGRKKLWAYALVTSTHGSVDQSFLLCIYLNWEKNMLTERNGCILMM
jgi:hypothetical protein